MFGGLAAMKQNPLFSEGCIAPCQSAPGLLIISRNILPCSRIGNGNLCLGCNGERRRRRTFPTPRFAPQSLATFRGARPSRSLLPRVPLGSSVGGTPTEAVETTALPGIITLHPFEQGLILSRRIGVPSLLCTFPGRSCEQAKA